MAVALLYQFFLVCGASERALFKVRRIRAEAHGAAVFVIGEMLFLLEHDVHHWTFGILLYLGRVRILQLQHIARVLDDHELHAVAEAEVRDLVFARELYRLYLPLDTGLAEAAGDDDALIGAKFPNRFRTAFFYVL